MTLSFIIFWGVGITTILSDNISYCNDECLLSKLKINNIVKNTRIILPSYNISNNVYKDSALLWTNPCKYFSNVFLQTFTNKKNPTNNDFRQAFFNRYIKANNLSLILQINTNNPKNIDIQYLNSVISMYRFDGYIYNISNNINTITKHKRVLLSNHYSDESEVSFDMLNQRTWDEYDWFLYIFSILSFGSSCLCCGWCGHKKYIADQMLNIEDIDERKVTISPKSPLHNKYIQDVLPYTNNTLQPVPAITLHMRNNIPIQPIKIDNTMATIVAPSLTKQQHLSIDAVGSPDSAEPSESHLTIEMYVKRMTSNGSNIQSTGYTLENSSINETTNRDDIDNPYADIIHNEVNNNES
eukprot:348223_1